MRIFTNLGGPALGDVVDRARQADRARLDAVLAIELQRNPLTQAVAAGAATRRVEVGTGIALAFVRSPLSLALAAWDLDELTQGRALLGLGSGVPRVVTDWHGAEYPDKPVTALRETVEAIRTFWDAPHDGSPISYEGEEVSLSLVGYQRPEPELRRRVPILLAGVGPVMCRTAGEVADGLLTHLFSSRSYLEDLALPQAEEGRVRAARDDGGARVIVGKLVAVGDDEAEVRRRAALTIGFYSTVRTYRKLLDEAGWGQAADDARAAFKQGDVEAMAGAIPNEMLDELVALGSTPEEAAGEVRRQLEGLDVDVNLGHPYVAVPPDRESQGFADLIAVARLLRE